MIAIIKNRIQHKTRRTPVQISPNDCTCPFQSSEALKFTGKALFLEGLTEFEYLLLYSNLLIFFVVPTHIPLFDILKSLVFAINSPMSVPTNCVEKATRNNQEVE
jgi:hypothetical protein